MRENELNLGGNIANSNIKVKVRGHGQAKKEISTPKIEGLFPEQSSTQQRNS